MPWDGIQGDNRAGFATHTSILFGPWHRAYLALYEQIIWTNAQYIAATYPDDKRATYQAAALTLRIPYWDWASHPTMPDVVTNPNIVVNAPTGQKTINNPFYSFKFNPLPADGAFPAQYAISRYHNTLRFPDKNAHTQTNMANTQLLINGASIRDSVYNLIAQQSNYPAFSNTGYTGSLRNGSYNSLESIHNQIHALSGGTGHMGYIPYSAFDPLFFLHHANVDRLDAIRGAIYPDSYVEPQTNQEGTYIYPAGTVEDANTPLMPFRSDADGSFHTAITARYPKNFGYSYPEIVDWGVDAAQVSSNVRAAFNALYNPTGTKTRRRRSARSSTTSTSSAAATSTSIRQWFVNLKVNKNSIEKSFQVHFFLGAPPTDSASWPTASNLISTQSVLSKGVSSSVNIPYMGAVPLTRTLTAAQTARKLASLEPSKVGPYLKANLQWRVTTLDGTIVSPMSLADLKISVVDQTVQKASKHDQFNLYSKFTKHEDLVWGNGA